MLPVQSLVKATSKVWSFGSSSGNQTQRIRRSNSKDKNTPSSASMSISVSVAEELKKIQQQSPILRDYDVAETVVYYYDNGEVLKGSNSKLLRSGQFYDTFKIKRLPGGSSMNDASTSSEMSDSRLDGSLHYQSSSHRRGGGGRDLSPNKTSSNNNSNTQRRCYYTLKQLHHHNNYRSITNSTTNNWNHQALLRLILESEYLSRLEHPHLIRLKGLVDTMTMGTTPSFFMISERIVETLETRMERWRQYKGDKRSQMEEFVSTSHICREKMMHARDIASALQYLHKHKLAVINLSPSTMGFLEDGTIQITDLSCCREIVSNDNDNSNSSSDEDPVPREVNLTLEPPPLERGQTQPVTVTTAQPPKLVRNTSDPIFSLDPPELGRSSSDQIRAMSHIRSNYLVVAAADGDVFPRHVAPEVIVHDEISIKADSYSWALVVFELFTLSKPYASYKPGQHVNKVCIEGQRPNVSVYKQLPKSIQVLLKRTWRQTPSKRYDMAKILQILPDSSHRKAVVLDRGATVRRKSPVPAVIGASSPQAV